MMSAPKNTVWKTSMTHNFSRRFVVASVAGAVTMPVWAQRPAPARTAQLLLAAARTQIGVTVAYDPAYSALAFPGGDVARGKGVCTDVLIRAYRDAFGLDLQALVHADMQKSFAAYPKRWGLKGTDKNIDHRRVPNLQTFFSRAGAKRAVSTTATDWQPGDIFTSLIDNRLPHTGLVSDRKTGARPWVIHNIGGGTREEDALFAHPLTGHYRWEVSA
jgi:uncharacterized protein